MPSGLYRPEPTEDHERVTREVLELRRRLTQAIRQIENLEHEVAENELEIARHHADFARISALVSAPRGSGSMAREWLDLVRSIQNIVG